MKFHKYPKNCQKCNRIIPNKEEDCNGLCFPCYQDYLYEKVENMGKKMPTEDSLFKKLCDKIKTFFKKK